MLVEAMLGASSTEPARTTLPNECHPADPDMASSTTAPPVLEDIVERRLEPQPAPLELDRQRLCDAATRLQD